MSASPSPPPIPGTATSTSPSSDRRPSFGFLRRPTKSEHGGKTPSVLQKKQKQQSVSQPQPPSRQPTLPTIAPTPTLPHSYDSTQTPTYNGMTTTTSQPHQFSGQTPIAKHFSDDYHAMPYPPNYNPSSSPPIQPRAQPVSRDQKVVVNSVDFDPYAKTESMAHRGRYSYASTTFGSAGINSPRRVRRRKDPTPFNILIVGAKNSGKSSFIDFLKDSLKLKPKSHATREKTPSPPATAVSANSPFTPHYLETEIDHERIGVTLWDSQGLERKFVDLQLKEMVNFIETKFEETFTEEQKVNRSPGVRDTHIHCVFLVLDPSRLDNNLKSSQHQAQSIGLLSQQPHLSGILDQDLDIQVLQNLKGKTTVIPIISKADTVSTARMVALKKEVWASIKAAKLDPLEALNLLEEDVEDPQPDEDGDIYHNSSSDLAHEDSELIDRLVDRSSDDDAYHRKGGAVQRYGTPPTSSPKFGGNLTAPSPSNRANRLSAAINNSPQDLPAIPMSIISPDTYEPAIVGRRFPWGFADPYNAEHCDFVRLKDSVFSEWRAELREASREVWYEGWRTLRLRLVRPSVGGYEPAPMRNITPLGGAGARFAPQNQRSISGLGPKHPNHMLRDGASHSPVPSLGVAKVKQNATKQADIKVYNKDNHRATQRSASGIDNGINALTFDEAVHPHQTQTQIRSSPPVVPSASKPVSADYHNDKRNTTNVATPKTGTNPNTDFTFPPPLAGTAIPPGTATSNPTPAFNPADFTGTYKGVPAYANTNVNANNNATTGRAVQADSSSVYGDANSVQMPHPGGPEMVAGRYHSGVNAF